MNFQFLYDKADIGIGWLTLDGQFLHVNAKLSTICGYEADELCRVGFGVLMPSLASQQDISWISRLQEAPFQSIKDEIVIRRKNGHSVVMSVALTPVFDPSGVFSYYIGVFEDISERKLNNELLYQQSQVLELIAKNQTLNQTLAHIVRLIEEQATGVLSTIYLLDKEGRLRLGAAPSWPETFVREVDGASIGPEAGSCGAAAYYGKRIVSLDISQDGCWGGYRDWILSYGIRSAWSTPVLGKDGSVLGTVSMCWRELRQPTARDFALVDVATRLMGIAIERQQNHDLILQQQMKLVSSSKMAALGEMAGGVAHEINNPLAIIHGYAQKLESHIDRGNMDIESVQKIAGSIKLGALRISKIVKGLRAIARDGENDPFQNTLLQNIMDDTLELCRERILHNGIQFHVEEFPPDLSLECRAVQISQVILNLLNNSYDALQSLPERWIRLAVEAEDDWITISVTDSGQGIQADIREQIMQPFFSTKKLAHGTGLGLSISSAIIASHNGRFFFDEQCPNTRFVLSLPRRQHLESNSCP